MRRYACVVLVCLAGCGGGGGGGSRPSPAPTGISEDYYPVSVGARWSYAVTSSDVALPYVDNLSITGFHAGTGQWVFLDSDPAGDGVPVESYYRKDARAFTFVGDNDPADWLTATLTPMDLMRFDGTFSASPLVSRSNANIGVDLDNDGLNETISGQVNGTVEGFETLNTDVGSFSNTARIRYSASGTVTLTTGASIPVTQTVREWRAPGLGAIRQTIQTTVGGSTSTTTLELKGLSVNGILGGILPPSTLLANLGSASSDETRPGRPALASDGHRHLLISNRQITPTTWEWLGQFIAADGQLQSSVSLSPATNDLWGHPAVAWNGVSSTYAVVSGSGTAYGMRFQRISATGVVLDAYPGTELAPDGLNRALAAGGGKWLAVYQRNSVPGALLGRLVDANGLPGVEFTVASTGVADFAQPAVAFDGSNFLIAWESGPGSLQPANTDIHARRVSPQGVLLEPAPFTVSAAAEAQWMPQIACDPTNCLIAWVDRRNHTGQSYNFSPGPGDLYGTLIGSAGTPLQANGLAFATGITANAGYPGLTFNGSDYVLAWSRGAFVNNPGGPTGIYAMRISTAGVASPAMPGLAVSGPPPAATRYLYPTLASAGSGALVVWLHNAETSGSTKQIDGTVIWPKLTR